MSFSVGHMRPGHEEVDGVFGKDERMAAVQDVDDYPACGR